MSLPDPSGRPRRRPVLLILLGVVGLAYLVSLPWQRRQWEATQKIREENALQEARIQEIKTQQAKAQSVESRLQNSGGDLNTQLDAVRAFLSRGDTARAGSLLQQIETQFLTPPTPLDPALASTVAGLFQEAGWIDRALVNAQRACEAQPTNVEYLLRLGVVEAKIGWQTECRAHIKAARQLAPDAAEPHIALALLCEQVGASLEGEQELLAADRLRPKNEAILQLLFQNRMDQRHYEAALATAEEGLKINPGSIAFLAGKAEALIEWALVIPGQTNTSRLQAGLEAALKYQRLVPESMDAHYLIGRAHQGLGDEASALREWEIVFASSQKSPKLAINLGRLLARHGDRQRGQRLIEAGEKQRMEGADYNRLLITAGMLQTDPEKKRAFARWCQAHRRYSDAILGWDQVLKLKPDDAEAKTEREKCVQARLQGPKPRP